MDKDLREKIIELFEYRELPKLIKYRKKDWNEDFYEKLIQLQYDIYLLDHELETNWSVDMDVITSRWNMIYKDLDALNVPRVKHDDYCSHIYKYQRHELGLRDYILPTRLSMEFFYFYKSCDVKLLRRLIYDENPQLKKVIKTSDWRLFDLVTEINDDVEDLQEDTATINGNRFLISLLQFGPNKTMEIFNQFLEEVGERNDRSEIHGIHGIELTTWTKEQIEITTKMVMDQAAQLPNLDLTNYKRFLRT